MYSLRDKVAVVTGAANGIGASIVRKFFDEGARYVATIDIDDQSGLELIEDIRSKYGAEMAKFHKCDITKTEELNELFNKILEDTGSFDIVVNNAASANESHDKYKELIDLNFTALVSSNLKALELMRVDKGGQGGTIINVSSITALSSEIAYNHIYAASKAAVLIFSNRLGMDAFFSITNVRVLTVCFGATRTDMLRKWIIFDDFLNEMANKLLDYFDSSEDLQSPDEAAKGVAEIYQKGASGSTWLVNKAKVIEITEKIKKGNEIMASDVIL